MIKLSDTKNALLRVCLEKHRPDLLWVFEEVDIVEVNEAIGDELRDAVGTELAEEGFDPGGTPNNYGLALESLMDDIGRLMWEK